MSRRAVFLDRDGVVVAERHGAELHLLPGVPHALAELHGARLLRVVVTNQPVVARGLATEDDILRVHTALEERLVGAGAPRMTAWRFCPHHPNAAVFAYRCECACRKPRPGMLIAAARELDIDLTRSFLVGDRLTDIEAGKRAGCRAVQVLSGAHDAPRIETPDSAVIGLQPDVIVPGLLEAAAWILAQSR